MLDRGWIFPTKLRYIFHHTLIMLLHYLEKVNSSNLLQITTEKKIKKRVVFDKNETFMLSYSWLEIGVLFYSIYSKCPPFACTHARNACATRQCIVSDALLDRGWIFPTKLRNIFHHTLIMLLHYLGKVNSSNLLQILKKMQTRKFDFWKH